MKCALRMRARGRARTRFSRPAKPTGMLWRLATAAAGISVGAAAATVWWKHSPSPTPPPRCDSVRHEPSGSSPSDMLVRKAERYKCRGRLAFPT